MSDLGGFIRGLEAEALCEELEAEGLIEWTGERRTDPDGVARNVFQITPIGVSELEREERL